MDLLDKILDGYATLSDQCKALKAPLYAYMFARDVPGANIKKCQEVACKDPEFAFYFARDVEWANIEKCQEAACKEINWAYCFAKYVEGADLAKIKQLYLEISDEIDSHFMNKALR